MTATIIDGKYAFPENQGLEAGKYLVSVNWLKPTGKKVRDEDGDVREQVRDLIPAKYNEDTSLRAEVSKDSTKFDFDLKK